MKVYIFDGIKLKVMDCPYCKKDIYGLTGLMELQKFHKHLSKCRKNPKNKTVVSTDGSLVKVKDNATMYDALQIRAESGQ